MPETWIYPTVPKSKPVQSRLHILKRLRVHWLRHTLYLRTELLEPSGLLQIIGPNTGVVLEYNYLDSMNVLTLFQAGLGCTF